MSSRGFDALVWGQLANVFSSCAAFIGVRVVARTTCCARARRTLIVVELANSFDGEALILVYGKNDYSVRNSPVQQLKHCP
ncbi:hypothetical protein LMG27174_00280 [Paraburkholderia rhynchosiae]|uniref:Uncharacterized protein n=1 Tax=Paraburkholderia rhynchosiae TaxID=487049 RepID=A0A6J5A757_9BURK|nr:hypothetical protein LMG27174_00280 [Paraburkholderia rhynchosiae]